MKQISSTRKLARHTERNADMDASAGPAGVAVAPPSYGLDLLDQARHEEVAEYEVPEGALQRQAVSFSAGDNLPEGPSEEKKLPFPLQAKLTIGPVNDKYEQEANRVAEHVMRMPAPSLQRQSCACGKSAGSDGMCADCRQKELGIQRMASGSRSQTTAPPIVHQVLRQPGYPLDKGTRNFMESRFGEDFSQVRVHTDPRVHEAADAVQARAFTQGRNIVFGEGQYAPKATESRQLLAHELAHVVQQRGGTPSAIQRQERDENIPEGQRQATMNRPIRRPSPSARPATVYICAKDLDTSPVGRHAFFRIGGSRAGNPTLSLQPIDTSLGVDCWQGIPNRNYPSDFQASADCDPTAISVACLEREFRAYPIGHYCTWGPNSNTFVGHIARACGVASPDPSGWTPGIDESPPPSGTFAPDKWTTLAGCETKQCIIGPTGRSSGSAVV